MYKIKIPIGKLFDILDITNIDEVTKLDGANILTPSGKYTPIRGFIKKSPKNIYKYTFENTTIECSDEHLFQENGITKKAKDCSYIDTINGTLTKTKSEFIEKDFVFDIAIDSPHLYVTPNGIIHHNTTLVQVISNELDAETLFINASLENGIDILRSKIADFASSCSFDGSPKIVILDEADNLNKTSTQPAFRGFLDEFSKNCTFIFTCNYQDKLIEPLKDRLVKFNFDDIFYQNKKEIGLQSIKRLKYILENEEIQYDIEDVKQILLNLYPGLRDMTMYIQNNTRDNVLHISDNLQKSVQYKNITDFIKNKDFTKMRQEVSKLTNPDTIYTWMWNNLDTVMEQPSQPEAILIIAKYQFQAASAVDKELNACAMCTELMGKGNIKWI